MELSEIREKIDAVDEQLFGIRDAELFRLRVGAVAAASHGDVDCARLQR